MVYFETLAKSSLQQVTPIRIEVLAHCTTGFDRLSGAGVPTEACLLDLVALKALGEEKLAFLLLLHFEGVLSKRLEHFKQCFLID